VDYLNCRSLGLDEARLAVNIAARSWGGLLRPLDLDQTAPPLFLWAERLAFLLSGRGDCALRFPPVAAGIAAALLVYPLARRFLERTEARLAALIAVFAPLLITYSNAVKQYSVELLTAVLLILVFERALRPGASRRSVRAMLAAGVVAPWIALSSVFVLAAAWLIQGAHATRGRAGAVRLALASAAVWGASAAAAYAAVYRPAARNPYLQRFWELAFVSPARDGFAAQAWKTLEDQVWGFLAGDPLLDRQPFLWPLRIGTIVVAILCLLGCRRLLRSRGPEAVWWLTGPALLTLSASMLGLFPIAPRLTLFLLPGLIVLVVAGLSAIVPRGAAVALAIPLAGLAIVRTFSLEPPGHFQRLVRELKGRRLPGEPVYVFARSLPPWIFYSTDWSRPDTARLRVLVAAAGSGGAAFENAPSRGAVRAAEAEAVAPTAVTPGELLGLPSGLEWREVEEHVRAVPDSGWMETERRRIEAAAAPGVWVLATAYYDAETALFETLEREASRRTFALLRGGSALVRYEFAGGAGGPVQNGSATLGRRSTAAIAGR
jgi:hypothetical protein